VSAIDRRTAAARWAAQHNEQRRRLLTMGFRTFQRCFIEILKRFTAYWVKERGK
jgi:hypothetical protein